jgi:glycosyltransferase involved in cell wall biosynthesis
LKKLAIITTHPIQYYAPVFKLLHERGHIQLKVFYTWGKEAMQKFDPGFGKDITWDIPLLDGYEYEWVENTAIDKGSHHFKGIINPRLNEQINVWQPDCILVYGWAYHSHLKAMRHFKNKLPVFFRGDSTLLDEPRGLKKHLKSLFSRWVYSYVNHAFYVGINNKAYFKKYGLKETDLSFAPHTIDNNRFREDRSNEAGTLRKDLHIPQDDILIVFTGKFEKKKAPLLLLNAFLKIKSPNVQLLFVGNGKLEPELKQKAASHPRVHFLAFQNQLYMPVIYQACDLFCMPSAGPGETWGLAVNEAMACSKPVLVSDKAGSAADLVKDGYNGAIFEANSLHGLTTKLNELTSRSKATLAAMGNNSKAIIDNYTFQIQAQAIESAVLKHG